MKTIAITLVVTFLLFIVYKGYKILTDEQTPGSGSGGGGSHPNEGPKPTKDFPDQLEESEIQ